MRVVMQANHSRQLWPFGQSPIEKTQFIGRKLTKHFAVYRGIQHDKLPAALYPLFLIRAGLRRNRRQQRRIVVITSNPERGAIKRLQLFTEIPVGLRRCILGEVSGGKNQVGLAVIAKHFANHRRQAVTGVDSQQGAIRRRHQVRIGKLQHIEWARRCGFGHARPVLENAIYY